MVIRLNEELSIKGIPIIKYLVDEPFEGASCISEVFFLRKDAVPHEYRIYFIEANSVLLPLNGFYVLADRLDGKLNKRTIEQFPEIEEYRTNRFRRKR